MSHAPQIQFLSLFVPNLEKSVEHYRAMLGIEPGAGPAAAPAPHPFATKGPVVFQLGEVSLALYECDTRTTHAGDVGIGLSIDDPETVHRFRELGGNLFWGPNSIDAGKRQLSIGVMPDRHFFEIVGPKPTGE